MTTDTATMREASPSVRMARRRRQIADARRSFNALPERKQAELRHGIATAAAEAEHIRTYRRPA